MTTRRSRTETERKAIAAQAAATLGKLGGRARAFVLSRERLKEIAAAGGKAKAAKAKATKKRAR